MANKAGQIRAAAGQPARSTKATPLVRYPKATNALRALLVDGTGQASALDPARGTSHAVPRAVLRAAEIVRRSPPERSKPSLSALRLLMGVVGDAGQARFVPGTSEPRDLPRLEPVTLANGASLGEVVRIRRQMKKLSQQRLADLAGVGRRFIGELEAGKPTVELGKTLATCRALGLMLTVKTSDAR